MQRPRRHRTAGQDAPGPHALDRHDEQDQDSLSAIQKDLNTIKDNSGKLADQFKSDVKTANEQFTNSVKETASNLGKSVSAADAKTQFQTAMTQLVSSYQSSFGKLKC